MKAGIAAQAMPAFACVRNGHAGGVASAYQVAGLPSRKKPPVASPGVAAQTTDDAPCSTLRGADRPPIRVRTQPGQTALT